MIDEKDRARELMVELINLLPGYTPLPTPKESSEVEMRYALASMYKDKGFRDYMIRAIRLNLEGFQHVTDSRGLWVQQGRLLVCKELLMAAKQMFNDVEKLNSSLAQKMEKTEKKGIDLQFT